MFKPVFYFTISGICILFSVAMVVAQAILRVNKIFGRIGLYLLVSSLVSLTYALFNVPGMEPYSREILITQRMISLAGGFPLISLIASLKPGFLKRSRIGSIYGLLSVLFAIALVDLIGDFGWLFRDPPPRANASILYLALYVPFSFIALPGSFILLIAASRRLPREEKRLVNFLIAGMGVIVLSGLWDYIAIAVIDDPFDDRVYLYNPAIIVLALMIFAFIIQFIRLKLKYRKDEGRSAQASPLDLETRRDEDRDVFERITKALGDLRLYADPDIDMGALGKAVGLAKNAVSRIVNEGSGGNFSAFINAFRVEEMKRRLADAADAASVMEIGTSAGFKSKASMNRVFKESTGMTPVEFRRRDAPRG